MTSVILQNIDITNLIKLIKYFDNSGRNKKKTYKSIKITVTFQISIHLYIVSFAILNVSLKQNPASYHFSHIAIDYLVLLEIYHSIITLNKN